MKRNNRLVPLDVVIKVLYTDVVKVYVVMSGIRK